MDSLKVQHGFYRDYLICEEGIYKIDVLSFGERLVVEIWPFAFLAAFWLVSSLVLFAAFAVAVVSELYIPRLIGNQKRKLLYAKPNPEVISSGILIPWDNITSIELSDKVVVFSLGGKLEGGRIASSDYGAIRDYLFRKAANRLVVKQTQH